MRRFSGDAGAGDIAVVEGGAFRKGHGIARTVERAAARPGRPAGTADGTDEDAEPGLGNRPAGRFAHPRGGFAVQPARAPVPRVQLFGPLVATTPGAARATVLLSRVPIQKRVSAANF